MKKYRSVKGSSLENNGKTISRPSLQEILEENIRKLENQQDPKFPKLAEKMDDLLYEMCGYTPSLVSSFCHAEAKLSSDKISSMKLLDELRKAGFTSLPFSYDFAMPEPDASVRIVFGSNIRSKPIFSKNPKKVPYVYQEFSPAFLEQMTNQFEQLFNRLKGQAWLQQVPHPKRFLYGYKKRLFELRDLFLENLTDRPNHTLINMFNSVLRKFSIESRFVPYSGFRTIDILILQHLHEDYGINFIELLNKVSLPSLRTCSDGAITPAKVSIEDSIYINGKPHTLDEIFSLLYKGELTLTPSALILAALVSNKPHMGGKDWVFYAPIIYGRLFEALDFQNPSLILHSYGVPCYQAYLNVGANKKFDTSLWHGYPLVGNELSDMFSRDEFIEVSFI